MIYQRLQRFVRSRSLCVMLATLMVLSSMGACITLPTQAAYADSAVLTVGHKIEYASWDTNAFTVNGFEAYCGEPSARTPESGTYEMQPLTNASVAAGLWFGFGGPGFDADLWPKDCPIGTGDDGYRMMTHLALAYLASGNASFAYEKCDQSFKDWCDGALFGAGSICERIRNAGFTLNGASDSATTLPQGFTAYAMNTGSETQLVYAMSYRPRGYFSLKKTSSRPGLSDHNACYSLEGATYGIFSDAACTQNVGTVVTDAAGAGRSPELDAGTYYIKEITPPKGYALSPAVSTVVVKAGTNGTVRVQDEPQSDPVDVLLRKVDAETGEPRPLGGATLGGAKYTVRFFAGDFTTAEEATASSSLQRTWVFRTNAAGELHLNEDAKVSGDELYSDAQGRPVLPLGTLTLEETAAPAGYLLGEGMLLARITAEGTDASVDTYRDPSHPEQVIRGDLSFKKARETDQHRLAGIPFRLTSNTTGESHIIVTDENGEAKTSSAWNAHTMRTNGSDAAVSAEGIVDEALLDADAGLWFGTDDARDELGALPFDTYALAELAVEANEGLELITIPSLTIKRDGYEVDLGTLDDQPSAVATLRTHASDATEGDKLVDIGEAVTVVDQVHYAGVTPGKEYRIAGHLVERASATVITDSAGEPVTNSATFTADADAGVLDLAFTFDATAYAASDIVVLEELTDLEADTTIAAESNLNDSEQTVHIAPSVTPTPAVDRPEPDRPLVHTAGASAASAAPAANPLGKIGLVQTGDEMLSLACCVFAGAVLAALGTLRLRRTNRRRKLRAALRTGA